MILAIQLLIGLYFIGTSVGPVIDGFLANPRVTNRTPFFTLVYGVVLVVLCFVGFALSR